MLSTNITMEGTSHVSTDLSDVKVDVVLELTRTTFVVNIFSLEDIRSKAIPLQSIGLIW